jgi:S1-C subfamily serine protease
LVILDKRDVRIFRMGDSDRVRIGEIVFAIGSPLGLPGPSVSMGIVSSVGRTIAGVSVEGGIRARGSNTDRCSNKPGKQWGALVNLEGEAIGISTAITPYARNRIRTPNKPSEEIHTTTIKIRKTSGSMGRSICSTTNAGDSQKHGDRSKKVIVVRVVPGSQAHEQGIQSRDIITRAGENEISKPLDLRKAIEDNIDKGEIELEIIRRGRIARLAVPIYIEEL